MRLVSKTAWITALLFLVPPPVMAATATSNGAPRQVVAAAPTAARPLIDWTAPYPQDDQPTRGYPVLGNLSTTELYHATPATGTYSHHPMVTVQGRTLYTSWSNGVVNEDNPGQRVLGTVSTDGGSWAGWKVYFPPHDKTPPDEPGSDGRVPGRVVTADGYATIGGDVYAVAEVWDWVRTESDTVKRGWGRIARRVAPNGTLGPIFWLEMTSPEPKPGFPSYPNASDPRYGAIARQIAAYLADPRNTPPWDYKSGWTEDVPAADGQKLAHPTHAYVQADGTYVRIWRDSNTGRLYAQASHDHGRTWDPAIRTSLPDARSKSFVGRLPDGQAYIVGNEQPGGHRDPISISLASDGVHFDRVGVIRYAAPPLRYTGAHKNLGFEYPSAIATNTDLWVVYSVNKEDVAITKVPLSSLPVTVADLPGIILEGAQTHAISAGLAVQLIGQANKILKDVGSGASGPAIASELGALDRRVGERSGKGITPAYATLLAQDIRTATNG
ncbi:exo-alpha-sialidase [Actinoallomurus sp. CA-150999]|uniref:exo-alpha-sialidase n=1 Tax=Actinoallomurus sp. CA-150999 TaxID=3239887 RepID=UPI003D919E83